MLRSLSIIALLILATVSARGEEADDAVANEEQTTDEQASEDQGDGYKRPKTLSGMSILGNEEAPKSLVIIPWKSSELGDDISLSDTLDERARPVDKEVFLRELSFYEIRSGEQASSDTN
jgi:hypothetical protein